MGTLKRIWTKIRHLFMSHEEIMQEWRISQLPPDRQKVFKRWRDDLYAPKGDPEMDRYLHQVFMGQKLVESLNMTEDAAHKRQMDRQEVMMTNILNQRK